MDKTYKDNILLNFDDKVFHVCETFRYLYDEIISMILNIEYLTLNKDLADSIVLVVWQANPKIMCILLF